MFRLETPGCYRQNPALFPKVSSSILWFKLLPYVVKGSPTTKNILMVQENEKHDVAAKS